MPKTPFPSNLIAISIRIPPSLAQWVHQESERTGNVNAVIREILEDARTFYELPEVLSDQLKAEAKALGKTQREYVIHVLSNHAAELLRKSPSKKK